MISLIYDIDIGKENDVDNYDFDNNLTVRKLNIPEKIADTVLLVQ